MSPHDDAQPPETGTAWHPMLVTLLETFAPAGWKVIPELLLHRLPQRVDILILRQEHEAAGVVRKLHSIFDYLRPHTLIEHKGPTDDLAADDAMVLLGYAFQYMVLAGVRDPAQLGLMFVCDSIPPAFLKQVSALGGTLEKVGTGLWHGRVHSFVLHAVATGEAFRAAPTERLLYAFCHAFLKRPGAILPPLDDEERRMYNCLCERVEQFRTQRGSIPMKDLDLAVRSFEDLMGEMVNKLEPDRRAVYMRHVSPQDRVAGLAPQDRVAGLAPQDRVAGLAPQERLADLSPEEQVLALSDEVLRGLPESYIRTLSPATQAAIHARLAKS